MVGVLVGSALLAGAVLWIPGAGPFPRIGGTSSPTPMSDTARTYRFDLQGHRGARGLYPENTLPGFRGALEIGVHTLEMDLAISADSQVVVSHEPWFSRQICRTPDGDRISAGRQKTLRIWEMPYDRIAEFDCGSWGHPDFPEQKPVAAAKPRLVDVVRTAEEYAETHDRPPVRYNVETKTQPGWDGTFHPPPEPFVRLVLEALREGGVLERTTLQSFDPRTLRVARRLAPDLSLSLLVGRSVRPGLGRQIERLGFRPEVISPYYQWVGSDRVERAHEMGVKVVPWTVNDTETMRRLLELGVDGIITDYPNRATVLLE